MDIFLYDGLGAWDVYDSASCKGCVTMSQLKNEAR